MRYRGERKTGRPVGSDDGGRRINCSPAPASDCPLTRRAFMAGTLVAAGGLGAAETAFAEGSDTAAVGDGDETAPASGAVLLTQPFLQVPGEDCVNVVWFTENETEHNVVQLFEDGFDEEDPRFSREIEAVTTSPARIRDDDGARHQVYRHEATVDGLPAFFGSDKQKVAYRVISDDAASGVYSLQAQAQPGSGLRILLTSDIQCKNMVAANMRKLYELIGPVDAVLADGDIVDRGDAYVDWFSSEMSYFRVLQGQTSHEVGGVAYQGAPLLQNAPSYTAIGNHEVMGVYQGGAATLSTEFNDPKPRSYAEALYQERAAEVNPSGATDVREQFILDNSYNTQTYEDVLTLPENDEGNERYYAVTIGDVRLIVLDISRIWRGNSMGDTASKYVDPVGAVDATDSRRGFGSFIFEPIDPESAQYQFLVAELASDAFQSAKYRMVMFHWQWHSLGGNVVPAFADPVATTVTLSDGRQQVVYTYPMAEDYLKNQLEPLFERYNVDFVFNAHSHLWNRFRTESGMNVLESSNNGNTYNAFLDSMTRVGGGYPPALEENFSGDPALREPFAGSEEDYVAQGDPYGLSPVMPTASDVIGGNPYLMSNTVTEFSILDTTTGTVDSYRFDTEQPNSQPELFDSFPIRRTPRRTYSLDGSGVLSKVGAFATGYSDQEGGVAEIVAYNPELRRAYLVNGRERTLDIIDAVALGEAKPDGEMVELSLAKRVEMGSLIEDFSFGDITSVAVDAATGTVAVAVQAEDYRDSGRAVLLDPDGALLGAFEVGVQPDMIAFTPDGSRVLTADEGEPREGYGEDAVDPKGSVSIVDVASGAVQVVTFDAWDARRDELVGRNVILKKGIDPSHDFEPEYIAVAPDGSHAYVALQEANAVAVLDIEQAEFIGIWSLGFKNHLIDGNEIDANKDDKRVGIQWANLRGVYMPDGIAVMTCDGVDYVLTANEGDASEWGDGDTEYSNIMKVQIGSTSTWEPIEAEVLDPDKLDGLPAQTAGAHYILGGRSFSIYRVDASGLTQVFDSGSDFERITATRYPDYFNASNKNNKIDSRSDAKGPEPEAVVVGAVGDRCYAYVALERIGGIMVYDVTDPENASFVDYLNTRDFSVDFPDEGCDPNQGDIAPEGLAFVPAEQSPNGYPMLLAAHEVSGTLAVYLTNAGYVEPENPGGQGGPGGDGQGGSDGGQGGSDGGQDGPGGVAGGSQGNAGSGGDGNQGGSSLPATGDALGSVAAAAAILGAASIGAASVFAHGDMSESDT